MKDLTDGDGIAKHSNDDDERQQNLITYKQELLSCGCRK